MRPCPRCLVLGLALIGVPSGAASFVAAADPKSAADAALAARAALDADGNILERINQATRRIAAAVEPSVVHISIVGKRTRASEGPRGRGGGFGGGGGEGIRPGLAQGSGWVFDNQGHVVTNAHVADGAPAIVVQFQDGRSAAASVVGLDAATDVAVLKVDGVESLVPARRATGQTVSQGDLVYAFGSPFGFKFSMSQGVVSGVGRDPGAFSLDGYTNFIQSDAAVNPGNSGGPLVDVRGRVVGMNVAIATGANPMAEGDMGQSAGISFAIPLSTIEPIVEQLITTGTVSKGFLGVSMPLDDEANSRRLGDSTFMGPGRGGVVVENLVEGGPAEAAGLKPGDVIVALGDTDVAGVAQLRSLIATTRPGQTVSLRVAREAGVSDVKVGLVNLDAARTNMARSALARFGVEALADSGSGDRAAVRVERVSAESAAERAGLRKGATIISVRGIPTPTLAELLDTLVAIGFGSGARATVAVVDSDTESGPRDVSLSGRGSAAGN